MSVPFICIQDVGHLEAKCLQVLCLWPQDCTTYPPWHFVECMGAIPVSLFDHLQRLCPTWSPPEAPAMGRILVAGCGSGHQVAVELRSYLNVDLVALDVSAQAFHLLCRSFAGPLQSFSLLKAL